MSTKVLCNLPRALNLMTRSHGAWDTGHYPHSTNSRSILGLLSIVLSARHQGGRRRSFFAPVNIGFLMISPPEEHDPWTHDPPAILPIKNPGSMRRVLILPLRRTREYLFLPSLHPFFPSSLWYLVYCTTASGLRFDKRQLRLLQLMFFRFVSDQCFHLVSRL